MALEEITGAGGFRPSGRDKVNAAIRAVNQLDNLRGDDLYIYVRLGPGGAQIRLDLQAVLARVPRSQRAQVGFPVNMDQVSGSAGSLTTQCSFTYTVKDALTGEVIAATDVSPFDPTAHPRGWQRATIGFYIAARSGWAYYDSDGDLVIPLCNEVPDAGECPPPP